MTTTFQSANAALGETTEDFHTANDELPPGNLCASSTRRKEVLTHGVSDESIKYTRGSSLVAPAPAEEVSIPQNNQNLPRQSLEQCPKSYRHC